MSEIRTRLQGGTPFFPNMLNNGSVEVCLKEDVDKVLAKKDKELRRHKYKRCLAMAMWCKSKSEIYNAFAADASEYMPSYEARFHSKAVLYQKWATRWLELAEKFKEAK